MEEKNLWLNTEGVLEWCWREVNLEQHSTTGKAEYFGKNLRIKALLRFSFDLQIFEHIAQKHPFKDVSKQRGHGIALWSTSPVQRFKLLPLAVRWEERGPWRHFLRPNLPQSYLRTREHSRVPPPVSPDFFFPLLVKTGSWEEEIALDIQPPSQNHTVDLDIKGCCHSRIDSHLFRIDFSKNWWWFIHRGLRNSGIWKEWAESLPGD